MKHLLLLFLLCITINSCMVNYHMIGDGAPKDKTGAVKYNSTTQFYFFYGLVRVNRTEALVPADKPYLIRTSYNFWDSLLTGCTLGVVSARHQVIFIN